MLPLHDPLLADPLRAPSVAWGLASDILSASSGAARLVVLAAEQQGHPVDLKAASNVVEDAWRKSDRPDALFDAIADFYDGGRRLSGNARDGLRRLAPRVPDRVGRIAAFLLRCRTSALAFHKIAFDEARLPRERLDRRNFDTLAMSWLDSLEVAPPADAEEAFRVAAAGVDWSALNQEALILAMAVDNAVIMLDSLEVGAMVRPGTVAESATGPATAMDPAMHFIWDTPQGRIALGGAGPQAFEGPHLLILDLGGDDSYRGAGSAVFPDRPIALIVDRSGNDAYAAADSVSPGCGGAVGGVAIVADLAGDDRWQAWQVGLGGALFGVGLLWDRGGNDTYDAFACSEGAAAWGIGALADNAGEDVFHLGHTGQGAGGPCGVGWLADGAGNDDYRLSRRPELGVPDRRGARGMGCGFGRHVSTGVGSQPGSELAGARGSTNQGGPALFGGLGLLVDAGGNDRYLAGEFSLGAGVNGGIGIVVEAGGDDRYRSYVQTLGFGREQGVGLMIEVTGNDSCESTADGLGSGWISGAGLFLDQAGDDVYSTDSGLGWGHEAGFGLFADMEGQDIYSPSPQVCGYANNYSRGALRQGLWSTGLFLDLRGKDRYVAEYYRFDSKTLLQNKHIRVIDSGYVGPEDSDTSAVRTRILGIGIDSE